MDILEEISSFMISKNVCGKVINSHINDRNPFIELRLSMLLSKISIRHNLLCMNIVKEIYVFKISKNACKKVLNSHKNNRNVVCKNCVKTYLYMI